MNENFYGGYEEAREGSTDGWDNIDISGISDDAEESPSENTLAKIEADWNSDEARSKDGREAKNSANNERSDDLFTLKHLDKTLSVGRDELVRLAQKGLDYDRVKGKYSQLSAFKAESAGALDFLSRLADERGVSVNDLVGGGAGADQIRRADSPSQMRNERHESDIAEFLEACPDVSSNDIPSIVWDEVAKGKSLLSAYALHQNESLRAELEAERQKQQKQAGERRFANKRGEG